MGNDVIRGSIFLFTPDSVKALGGPEYSRRLFLVLTYLHPVLEVAKIYLKKHTIWEIHS